MDIESGNETPDDRWDPDLAARLPGKLILVGLTYLDSSGELIEEIQIFGRVSEVEEHRGICLTLEGSRAGERFWLPPDTSNCFEAPAGQYRLRSTGEVVADPDFTATWSVNAPPSDGA